MYIVFFLILAVLGYGALFWRDRPILLLLGIIACTVLLLVPLDGSIIIGTEFDTTLAGTEQGEATDLDTTGSENLVLLALDEESWEFQVWIWLHVAILIIHSATFFSIYMRSIF